jgi:hypothetical protein
MRGAVRADRDEPEAGNHVSEMRERQEDHSAFGFCGAVEWRQIFPEFLWLLYFSVFRRYLRVHAADLRLPLIFRGWFPAL